MKNHNQLSEESNKFEPLYQGISSGNLICACAVCQKVRDAQGNWREEAIDLKSVDADITHGFCPDCLRKQYAQLEEFIRKDQGNSL